MHDAAPAFDYTVFVEDQDEPIAISRTASDWERTVQINAFGVWHRRIPSLVDDETGLFTTSCGLPYNSQLCPPRREELTGDLCPDCFSNFEKRKAAKHAAEQRKGTLP